MRFERRVTIAHGLEQINMAPLIDIIFQLLIFFMLSSSFTFQSGIQVKLPKALTSEAIQQENFTLTISGEDVLYWGDKVLTVKELDALLKDYAATKRPVFIKADRRSSTGRVIDVWDLCRKYGIERINIATHRNEGR